LGNLKGTDNSEDMGEGEGIILKLILMKLSGKVWTRFILIKVRAFAMTFQGP
jgi:hypothetical protein